MESRHARVMVALAEERHFGRAAQRLNVVQSAISQTLKDLEEEVGAKLFLRSRAGVVPTQAGEALLGFAQRAIDELECGLKLTRQLVQGELRPLQVGASAMGALLALPELLARFSNALGDKVRLVVRQGTSESTIQSVLRGDLDLALLLEVPEQQGLVGRLLAEDELCVLLGAQHPLVSRAVFRAAELNGVKLARLSPSSEPVIDRRFRQLCQTYGIEAQELMYFEQLEALLAMVASDLVVALAPSQVARFAGGGVVARTLEPRVRVQYFAAWNPLRLNADTAALLALLLGERETAFGDEVCPDSDGR